MGSLFKAREAWSTKVDDELGFDARSLVVANVDNAISREGMPIHLHNNER